MVWLLLLARFFATLEVTRCERANDGKEYGKYQQRGSAKDFCFCAGVVYSGLRQRDLGPSSSEP
jgi:hypothetical protein